MTYEHINQVFEIQERLLEKIKEYKHRFLYNKLLSQADQQIFTGISGLRGAGKTVLLLQLLKSLDNAVYISPDFLETTVDFFELVRSLVNNYKIKVLLIDEIHYLDNWAKLLKNIYDLYDIKIYFTSSVSLDILHAKVDLARRVRIFHLPVLSFREYLILRHQKDYPQKSLEKILRIKANYSCEGEFLEFLKRPLPALLDIEPQPIIDNIIETIIFKDIATYQNFAVKDLQIIKKILEFISIIPGGDISISALANNFKITKYKATQYVDVLEKAFLVHKILPWGKNVLKEPKILLNIPFRIYLSKRLNKYFDFLGPLKEDFFISMLKAKGIEVYYLKTKRGRKTPDFYINMNGKPCIFEIGGRKKGFSQFRDIDYDCKYIVTYPYVAKKNSLPLYAFGFMY